jgi:hypothetical protein
LRDLRRLTETNGDAAKIGSSISTWRRNMPASRFSEFLKSEELTRANYLPEEYRPPFEKYAEAAIETVSGVEAAIARATDEFKPERARAVIAEAVTSASAQVATMAAANVDIRESAAQLAAKARTLLPKHSDQHAELRAEFRLLSMNERILKFRHTTNRELVAAVHTYVGDEMLPVEEIERAAARLGDPVAAKEAAALENLYTQRQLLIEAAQRAIRALASNAGVAAQREAAVRI